MTIYTIYALWCIVTFYLFSFKIDYTRLDATDSTGIRFLLIVFVATILAVFLGITAEREGYRSVDGVTEKYTYQILTVSDFLSFATPLYLVMFIRLYLDEIKYIVGATYRKLRPKSAVVDTNQLLKDAEEIINM